MDEKAKNKMKILILGSGSFAGQALFSQLLSEGYQVFGINRSKPKTKEFWEWVSNYKDILNENWYQVNIYKDVEKISEIIKQINPTHVVDFMGQGMVAPSWSDPKLWYSTNIAQKSYVLETIRSLKNLEKYVRASTPEVFGTNEKKLSENNLFNPSTPYAISHCAIDFHIRCLGRNYNFPYSIGRFSNFYGEGQQLYRVIPKAILCAMNKKKFIIDGKGDSLRSFIYKNDIVSAIKKLLFEAKPISEYNFCNNEEISIIELIKLIYKEANIEFNELIEFGPEREGKDMIYRMDSNKSISELGWKSNISLSNGIYRVFKWIKKNNTYFSKLSWDYDHKC